MIGQNYSWRRDLQKLVHNYAEFGGYPGEAMSSIYVNRIRDFVP